MYRKTWLEDVNVSQYVTTYIIRVLRVNRFYVHHFKDHKDFQRIQFTKLISGPDFNRNVMARLTYVKESRQFVFSVYHLPLSYTYIKYPQLPLSRMLKDCLNSLHEEEEIEPSEAIRELVEDSDDSDDDMKHSELAVFLHDTAGKYHTHLQFQQSNSETETDDTDGERPSDGFISGDATFGRDGRDGRDGREGRDGRDGRDRRDRGTDRGVDAGLDTGSADSGAGEADPHHPLGRHAVPSRSATTISAMDLVDFRARESAGATSQLRR